MPYTSNENAPQAGLTAVKLVRKEGWSQVRAAEFAGVHQGTISKWCAKAKDLRSPIPTESSRPNSSPNALPKGTIAAIWQARIASRNRCSIVVHDDLKDAGITVSLPSIGRTLKRLGLTKKRSKWKRLHLLIPRPHVTLRFYRRVTRLIAHRSKSQLGSTEDAVPKCPLIAFNEVAICRKGYEKQAHN